jgi:uncharacterized protein YjiS (DUF1127 family)
MMSYAPRDRTARRGRAASGLARVLRNASGRLVVALLQRQELAQQRRRLLSLDDRMLKDIGITRADASREGSRLFWDARGVDWTRWP